MLSYKSKQSAVKQVVILLVSTSIKKNLISKYFRMQNLNMLVVVEFFFLKSNIHPNKEGRKCFI